MRAPNGDPPQDEQENNTGEELEARISAFKKKLHPEKPPTRAPPPSHMLHAGTDLAAGVFIGLGLGYAIDKWAQTAPLFLIAGLFLGFAAGINLIWKRQKKNDPRPLQKKSAADPKKTVSNKKKEDL